MSKFSRWSLSWFPVLWMCLLSIPGAFAGEATQLYEAEAPVADQESEARNQAISAAFAEVLVKVSGERDALRRGGLAGEAGKAGRYVQQYRYLLDEAAAEDQAPSRRLRVRFDQVAVDQVLRRHGLPVWGTTRPAPLVWLAIEDKGRRVLYSPERDDSLRRVLERAAGRRGIPLLFPLMDLEDQGRLRASDLWGGFDARIREASARYEPDAILVGRVSRTAVGGWRAGWTVVIGDRGMDLHSEGASMATAVAAGMDTVADILAERFAPHAGDTALRGLSVRVTGLDDVDGYARAENYLRGLSIVEEAQAIEADASSVLFELQTRGAADDLQRAIGLGGVLVPATTDGPDSAWADGALNYRLRP